VEEKNEKSKHERKYDKKMDICYVAYLATLQLVITQTDWMAVSKEFGQM
jgi:hypothetical protein